MVHKTRQVIYKDQYTIKGTLVTEEVLSSEELCGHGKSMMRCCLKPGSSIAWHVHTGEAEQYYIIEGHGLFAEPDGSKVKVGTGDVCVMKPGDGHSIENASGKDLCFMAIIINE